MKLHESGEMYLETILVLSQTQKYVRSIDIANTMNYSKPSVSRAVGILKENNFIHIDKDGYITLTQQGNEIAKKIYERHTIISKFLESVGVSAEIAAQDACKIEHNISDESLAALKKYLADK